MAGMTRSQIAGTAQISHAEPYLLAFLGEHGADGYFPARLENKAFLAAQNRTVRLIHPAQKAVSFLCLRFQGQPRRCIHRPFAVIGSCFTIDRNAAPLRIKLKAALPILHFRREGDVRQGQDACLFYARFQSGLHRNSMSRLGSSAHFHLFAAAGTDLAYRFATVLLESIDRPVKGKRCRAVIIVRDRQVVVHVS